MTKVYLQNLSADLQQKINEGGGTKLPISASDVTETLDRKFITSALLDKITTNDNEITALSAVIDGINLVISEGKLTDEMVKVNAGDIAGYLNDKLDGVTITSIGNKLTVSGLQGLTVDVAKINLLTGASSNIQEQINNISKVVSIQSIVNTKTDLPLTIPPSGNTVLVRQDEDHANASTFYTSNGTTWEYVGTINTDLTRDFTTQPIDLVIETTGILPKNKYEKQNSLETSFDGNVEGFVAQNAQDAIKEVKTYSKNGIDTLTTNLATTNSNLALTNTKVQENTDKLVLTDALANEAKTLAQQAFQSGSDVKNQTVAQLLAKDPTLPITNNSSWAEINTAIGNIETGGNSVVGNKTSMITYEDILPSNEFIRYQLKGKEVVANMSHPTYLVTHSQTDTIPIGNDRAILTSEGGSEQPFINLLEYKNDKISVVTRTLISATPRGGNATSIAQLNDNQFIVLHNTEVADTNRCVAKSVTLNPNNSFTFGNTVNFNMARNAGFGHAVLSLGGGKFIGFVRHDSFMRMRTGQVASNGTTTLNEELLLSNNMKTLVRARFLDEVNKVILITALDVTNNHLKGIVVKVDTATNTPTVIVPDFSIDSSVDSGISHETLVIGDWNGKIRAVFTHNNNNKQGNNTIDFTIVDFDKTTYTPDLVNKKNVNIVIATMSGKSTNTGSNMTADVHSTTYLGEGRFLIVYKNVSVLEHAYFDINDSVITLKDITVIENGVNYVMCPKIINFGNRNFGLIHQNNSNNASRVISLIPETNLRKATTTDCISGVTNANGKFPQQIEITIPK